MEEKLDIYDSNRVKTGRIIKREKEEIFNDDEFVLVVQCWIINSKGEILLTQRKLEKTWGGMWEPTGGLVQSGENSIEGIIRELKEEIGVETDQNYLKFFKTVKDKNTFRDIYVINKDIAVENLKFYDREVINAKYVTIEEFKKVINDGETFKWLRWFLDDYYKMKLL